MSPNEPRRYGSVRNSRSPKRSYGQIADYLKSFSGVSTVAGGPLGGARHVARSGVSDVTPRKSPWRRRFWLCLPRADAARRHVYAAEAQVK